MNIADFGSCGRVVFGEVLCYGRVAFSVGK